jgi:hypothetical protein
VTANVIDPTPAEPPTEGDDVTVATGPALDVVTVLLAQIGSRTFLTNHELFSKFPELEPETEELARIYADLEANGI